MAIMLPDGVENLSGTTTATVTITQIGTTTKKLNVTDINVVNPNGLEYTLERNSLTVTFRGTKTMLDMLSSRNGSLTLRPRLPEQDLGDSFGSGHGERAVDAFGEGV